MGRILLIEDEEGIAQSLALPLQTSCGHQLDHCVTLKEARKLLFNDQFDAILLDLNLPDGNGIDFCKEIRKRSSIPILIVTARRDEVDRILGLELGADDYIVKPFSPREVAARINAVLRRKNWEKDENRDSVITHCGISLNETRREVNVEGKTVNLTRTEYDLVKTLMKRPGQVYSREMIVNIVWNGNYIIDRVVDSVISRIRRKLGKLANGNERIRTVHGVGYAMSDCPESL